MVIRSQRLGFAVIEGSVQLVDWGLIHYEGNDRASVAAAARRVDKLFALFAPSMVAIGKAGEGQAINPSGIQSIYRFCRGEAACHSIPVFVLDRNRVRAGFRDFGVRSKDEIAALLARMFPELQSKLPPKRRLWQKEHASMPMFDAVALAVTCWRRDFLKE